MVKNLSTNADVGDVGLIPGSGRFLGRGNGNPFQYSWLENPMDRGARWAAIHRVARNWTWLNDWACTHLTMHAFAPISHCCLTWLITNNVSLWICWGCICQASLYKVTIFPPFHAVLFEMRCAAHFSEKGTGVQLLQDAVMCLVAQSCLWLCDPMDCNPPGSRPWGFSRQEYWSGWPCLPPGEVSIKIPGTSTWEISLFCPS